MTARHIILGVLALLAAAGIAGALRLRHTIPDPGDAQAIQNAPDDDGLDLLDAELPDPFDEICSHLARVARTGNRLIAKHDQETTR